MLANLLDNALRHSGESPVQVVATAGAESAKLAIIDHGPGVPSGERERLFRPFQRLDDHSPGGVGSRTLPSRAGSRRRWAARWWPTAPTAVG